MTVRRLGAGLVAAALITPALAACASGTGTAGSTPSPTVSASGTASPSGAPVAGDAKQALLDSTKEISNGNFRFTLAGVGSTVEGLVHQPSQSAAMKIASVASSDLAMKLDVIHFKPDSWVKLELTGPTADSLPPSSSSTSVSTSTWTRPGSRATATSASTSRRSTRPAARC